jgi:dTDP-4-amino-4,6-dideoxygalactose transaminase
MTTAAPASTPLAAAVPFARTEISPEAQEAALAVLQSGWVTAGPETMAFEADLAAYLGAPHVVAVSSCTHAIELALRAMQLPDGAAVLTPSLTFCGAVQAILHAGLRPYLVDVDPDTLVPSPANVAEAAGRTGHPAAMVVQHHAGYPVDTDALASAAGLPHQRIVEDAAHGLGAYRDGVPVGSRSAAGCLSFYATKNLPIGEGGAVCSDDPEIAAHVRQSRLHGMTQDAWRRYLPGGPQRYDVTVAGLKANFTDLQAALGRGQLRHLDRWQDRRATLAAAYDAGLSDVEGLRLPPRPEGGRHAWHLYQVRVTGRFGLSRDTIAAALAEAGIGTSLHFIPVHQLSYFASRLDQVEIGELPATEAAAAELLSLPMHPGLADADVGRVCEVLSNLAHSQPKRFR